MAFTYPFSDPEVAAVLEQIEPDLRTSLLAAVGRARSRNARRGAATRAELGRGSNGRPRVISADAEAMAQRLLSEGLSIAQIAARLTAEEYPRGNGSTSWTRSAVQKVLASPYGAIRPESMAA